MKYIYSSIKLPEGLNNYQDCTKQSLVSIDNLSKVNIFVGSNNSGKSRFIRELAKITLQDLNFNLNDPNTKEFLKELAFVSNEINKIIEPNNSYRVLSFYITKSDNSVNSDSFKNVDFDFYNFREMRELVGNFINALKKLISGTQYFITSHSGTINNQDFTSEILKFLTANQNKIKYLLDFRLDPIDFYRTYIPILRSLNNFKTAVLPDNKEYPLNNDFYKSRVSNIYKFDNNDGWLEIFTGQKLYEQIRGMLLGDKDDRQTIARYEEFLKNNFFNNENVTIIPKEKHDVVNFRIGDDEKPIYDLGDGIQSIIILTFPLFTKNNGLFFIEEPESNLHAGMQRKFLDLLLNNEELKGKNHQYFITTHSNHFLDLTFDYSNISVYKFVSLSNDDKSPKMVEQVSCGDRSILQELGVKNSSVFLTNATIWVEGITDRLYIKKLLELYQKHNPNKQRVFEDSDYSFVEYGGNNITHWSFLDSQQPTIYVDRLCSASFLITDKDGENKIERQKELKKKLGNSYKCLDCREIENILSTKTIEKVIKSHASDSNYTLPPKLVNKYLHKENKIGTFIDNSLKPHNKQYSCKSGAIKEKLDFCTRAIQNMEYEELTPLAINLAKQVYNFVIDKKI